MFRVGHWLVGLALVPLLAGCTQSAQQLLLPEPAISNSASELATAARRRPGVRLGEPADPGTREPSVMLGTGELVGSPEALPLPLPAAGPGRDDVMLNLGEASIPAAAKAVLGDMLRYNYTISDKVKGTITLHTTQPVSRARLLEMFEAALQAQGAAIVVTGGNYRILPIEEALAAGAPIQHAGATGRGAVGVATQVVQLRHVSAPDMERLLKSVAPQSTAVRVDPQRNLVILTGNRTDLATLSDAIGVFDVDWMRGMSFAIFPVESADPEAIAQELDVVFANDREGPGKGIVRFVPNRRLKSILVITARQEYLGRAESWLRKLDMVGRATEKQVHVYHVQNRPAAELAQLLQRVYVGQAQNQSATAAATPPGATLTLPPAAPAPLAAVAGLPAAALPASTNGSPVLTLNGAAEVGLARVGIEQLGRPEDDRANGIGVVADEHNNSLVVTATAAEYRRIRQILTRIDIAPAQVLIESTIAEVTLNDELRLGMRWFFERNQGRFKLTDDAIGGISPIGPAALALGTAAPAIQGFSYFLNAANVNVVLNALSTITNVNIVSSPTLMVLDNKKAVLQIGDEVPIATQSAVAVVGAGSPIVNSVSFRSTGIILGITPRISDKGRVLLDIEQEVSSVVKTTSSDIDSPTIQQRRVRTTVAVADGETLMLAGMIQDKATRARGEVPLLGGLPLVGNIFKSKTDAIQRTELLIAITPRIVHDRHQVSSIVDEFRGKLNFNTRPQRTRPPDRHEQLDRMQR